MKKIFKDIIAVGQKHSADKIILFGSRARGDHREKSDIDIAVYGIPKEKHFAFSQDIGNIPTLLQFDI
ncbi:MAG: nucleotidyltransferase domain-containing protein, partial [Clostridia bacterium]|nr:nucleotidyltransferase domain-containing protein [Clostridia bacterium]